MPSRGEVYFSGLPRCKKLWTFSLFCTFFLLGFIVLTSLFPLLCVTSWVSQALAPRMSLYFSWACFQHPGKENNFNTTNLKPPTFVMKAVISFYSILFSQKFIPCEAITCSRLSDSGEDAKVKGTQKGGGGRKKEIVSSRFIFMFVLSQIWGPDYLVDGYRSESCLGPSRAKV